MTQYRVGIYIYSFLQSKIKKSQESLTRYQERFLAKYFVPPVNMRVSFCVFITANVDCPAKYWFLSLEKHYPTFLQSGAAPRSVLAQYSSISSHSNNRREHFPFYKTSYIHIQGAYI